MLEVAGLRKAFDGHRVLDGVDLAVGGGEVVALVGDNGSGKTTTLRAIAGLTLPDRGRIVICGVEARRRPALARRHLSFMPQKAVFPATLTVREVLAVAARLRDLDPARVAHLLDRCDLDALADRFVADLSGGQRQRVALAAALLPEAALYLFDEPSANLDAHASRILCREVARLCGEGRSVLFTTHVVKDLETLATRVARLVEGRIAQPATVSERLESDEESNHLVVDAARDGERRLWQSIAGARARTA
jgi:ABC-type multidrug transport system ATPase subunit